MFLLKFCIFFHKSCFQFRRIFRGMRDTVSCFLPPPPSPSPPPVWMAWQPPQSVSPLHIYVYAPTFCWCVMGGGNHWYPHSKPNLVPFNSLHSSPSSYFFLHISSTFCHQTSSTCHTDTTQSGIWSEQPSDTIVLSCYCTVGWDKWCHPLNLRFSTIQVLDSCYIWPK